MSARRSASVWLMERGILALATPALAGWDTHQLPAGGSAEHSTSGSGGGEQPADDFRTLPGAGPGNGCGEVVWHQRLGRWRRKKCPKGWGAEAKIVALPKGAAA